LRRAVAHAAAFALACALVPSPAATQARTPRAWSDALAGVGDTILAIGTHGELVRAPFDLSVRETLWTPPPRAHLVRLLVSPDRRRAAWLSRASDKDPTTLWVADAFGVRRAAGFYGVIPSEFGTARFEAPGPTVDDAGVQGARLLEPARGIRGATANAFAFRGEDDAVLFASRDGVGMVPPDTSLARLVSRALVTAIHSLDPAPMFLVEVLRLGEATGSPRDAQPSEPGRLDPAAGRIAVVEQGRYLFYPTANAMRTFPAVGLEPGDPRAASPATVWWSDGRRLSAVGAGDPTPRLVAEDAAPIVWLEYQASRRELLRATGALVLAHAEAGGEDSERVRAAAVVRAVLGAPGARWRGLVAGDSLVLWDPESDARRAFALGGLEPDAVVETSDGTPLVWSGGSHGKPARLARANLESGSLEDLALPRFKKARLAASPGREALVLYEPSSKPPARVWVWRASAPEWIEVARPDLIGWEPVAPF
jgi:hypothetical protein